MWCKYMPRCPNGTRKNKEGICQAKQMQAKEIKAYQTNASPRKATTRRLIKYDGEGIVIKNVYESGGERLFQIKSNLTGNKWHRDINVKLEKNNKWILEILAKIVKIKSPHKIKKQELVLQLRKLIHFQNE
jgi:hypothetical protein